MNVLQVGDNDFFGQRFNGHNLSQELRRRGHDAEHFVWVKHSDDPHTHVLAGHNPRRTQLNQFAAELHAAYSTHAMFSPFAYDLLFQPAFHDADVVHYHLLHADFASLMHLPILSRLKPTVWTLHDPWAITGHCVHPFQCDRWKTGCGQCPALDVTFAIEQDTTALNWEIKRQTYEQCDLDLIVASKWMAERVAASPLLGQMRLHQVPFGVDCKTFSPRDPRAARLRLGIEPDNLVLGLRAIPGEFKGIDSVRSAVRSLTSTRKITLLALNHTGMLDEFRGTFDIAELGWVHGDAEMATVYDATDVFLMPSAGESFGMMAMEAMACGTPSIVMDGTALPETVMQDQGGGIVVPQGDDAAFAAEVRRLVDDDELRASMGTRARQLALTHYDQERYVSETLGVYESAIARRGDDERASTIIAELRACAVAAEPAAAPSHEAPGSTAASAAIPPPEAVAAPPARNEPDSLEAVIRLHGMLRRSRLVRGTWRFLIKPVLTRLRSLRAARH